MKESKFTIIKDIQEIYDWLKKMNLCKEPKSIEKAISNCKSNSTNDYYDYRVSELEIDICDVFGGSIPNDVIVDKVVFSISIRGKYFDEKCLFDPVFQEINKKKHENFEYEFNIEVYGHKKIEDIWIDYYSSWHLDIILKKKGMEKINFIIHFII